MLLGHKPFSLSFEDGLYTGLLSRFLTPVTAVLNAILRRIVSTAPPSPQSPNNPESGGQTIITDDAFLQLQARVKELEGQLLESRELLAAAKKQVYELRVDLLVLESDVEDRDITIARLTSTQPHHDQSLGPNHHPPASQSVGSPNQPTITTGRKRRMKRRRRGRGHPVEILPIIEEEEEEPVEEPSDEESSEDEDEAITPPQNTIPLPEIDSKDVVSEDDLTSSFFDLDSE